MRCDCGQRSSVVAGVHVLDGGMATELEKLGASIDGPLWSAHVLEESPEKIVAVHRSYLEAGARCISTASYQVSRKAYLEYGYSAERADRALLLSVQLARQAVRESQAYGALVAASLGPYGAALHNGAEYHGNYVCSYDDLVSFHRERIEVLMTASRAEQPDLLAFETLPSLQEATAISEALSSFEDARAWFSFTCKDDQHVAHGETIASCVSLLSSLEQTEAIGVNCTAPAYVSGLIREILRVSGKPILVYPNSGEQWDGAHRCWTGKGDPEAYGVYAREWFRLGAQMIGGCCRTGPEHIRQVARLDRERAEK